MPRPVGCAARQGWCALGAVLPGKESVAKYAFSLPPDAVDRIEGEFSPDAKRWEDDYGSGPAS
ncbi:hypothetical protein [Streptomyces albospinus]|uniref:hypothetical protein n=1 Tax=Streptomyces albospinus TaxID=285515 RepID=UPI00167061B0|nr:hypothetical protein [Streptomyces albospinus]